MISYHPSDCNTSTYLQVGFMFLSAIFFYAIYWIFKPDPCANIPTVSPGSKIFCFLTKRKAHGNDFHELLVEGYTKYKGVAFRILNHGRWDIIVTRSDHIREIARVSKDVLSLGHFAHKTFFMEHLLGPSMVHNPYEINIIRSKLNPNLHHFFHNLQDEIEAAFKDVIPMTEDWTPGMQVYPKIIQIVTRASNRIFVGLPVCRNEDYLKINTDFTIITLTKINILNKLPAFMRHWAAKYWSTVSQSIAMSAKHLRPIVEEKEKTMNGAYSDMDEPTDILSSLMDFEPVTSKNMELRVANLTNKILSLNFGAIHTSGMSFIHALYDLAAEPHYIQSIREEVGAIIAVEGWTKGAMTKMLKLDSFLRESQRYNGISHTTMSRLALKDFTFSDGTFVPKGAIISAAVYPVHHDEELYSNSSQFDGFRFVKTTGLESEMSAKFSDAKNQIAHTSPHYIPFGSGKHACPGRFFAAMMMKVMMAYLVYHYDVKMENEGVRPLNKSFNSSNIPDLTAGVMFRRRQQFVDE